MSNSDTIALIGLVVNVILTLFNAGVALFIARKTIQAALEAARPAQKLRVRAIKRRRQHPLRKLIRTNRVEQVVSLLLFLLLFLISFTLTLSSAAPVLWWSLAAIIVAGACTNLYIFILSEQSIRWLKRNLRSLARKVKYGHGFDLDFLPKRIDVTR